LAVTRLSASGTVANCDRACSKRGALSGNFVLSAAAAEQNCYQKQAGGKAAHDHQQAGGKAAHDHPRRKARIEASTFADPLAKVSIGGSFYQGRKSSAYW
jgi:hypothetical protein